MWYGRWGESRFGAVWYGKVGRVVASYGEARLGEFRQARQGEFRSGSLRQDKDWQGSARQARYVKASSGRVWLREARLVKVRQAWYGSAWQGKARQGELRQVMAGSESQKGVDVEVGRNGRKAVFIFSQQVQSTC